MENYRLWYVKRGERVQGPFPEALICRFIVLGRVGELDALSLDRQLWRPLAELPELAAAVDRLIHVSPGVAPDDVDWREERAKAALRWLDDRKSPDPRLRAKEPQSDPQGERRRGADRRTTPETAEDHEYREYRFMFESWSREQRQRYGWAIVFVLTVGMLTLIGALSMQAVNPVKVGLKIHRSDCAAAPARGVDWSDCNLDGHLLLGADLRGAQLVGTSFKGANLRYADLSQANLNHADLAQADLTGVRLEGALWPDGRICAADSVGMCK